MEMCLDERRELFLEQVEIETEGMKGDEIIEKSCDMLDKLASSDPELHKALMEECGDIKGDEVVGIESTGEDRIEELAIYEEEIRQENFYDKEFIPKDETVSSKQYQEAMIIAETTVAAVRRMVKGGMDYNNSLSIINNYWTSKQNLELAEYSYVVQQQGQV